MKLSQTLKNVGRWATTRFNKRSAVLIYHRINTLDIDPFDMAVSPENFETQLGYLCDHFVPVPLLELVQDLHRGEIQQKKVAITFDDGYADVLENGLPLLEKYQVPATIYMVPGYLGRTPWWEKLTLHILQSPKLPQKLSFMVDSQTIDFQTDGVNRKKILKRIYPF